MTTDLIQSVDGFANTLLLAENINSGFWADVTPARRDLQTGYIAFGISVVYLNQNYRFPDQTKPTGMFGTVYGSQNFRQPGWCLLDGPGHNDATINSNLNDSPSTGSLRDRARTIRALPSFAFATDTLCLCHRISILWSICGRFLPATLLGQPAIDGDVR